jgi:hypothetical protein
MSHRVPVASVASLTFAYTEAVQRTVDTRRATENPVSRPEALLQVLDSASRSLRERAHKNHAYAVDMVLCDAAV